MADLIVEGLAKGFGDHLVLSDVDLRVPAETLTTLLGASGSGKTTLLRLICGFERPSAGTIRLDDRLVAGQGVFVAPERRRIGYVAQDGALFPHLSVAENIMFGLSRGDRTTRAADRLLGLVGLAAAYASRRPHELSGGEQQRVALARALAPNPRIVLLDEPFSSLDAALRAETRRAVAQAIAEAGATALLVTHDQAEALSLGARVAVLRQGRMAQVDTAEAIYRRPVDVDLAHFVGEAVVLDGEACGARATCALGTVPLASDVADGCVHVMIRPEQICLSASGDGVAATVVGVTFYGHDAMVALDLGALPTRLIARIPGHIAVRPGARVSLSVTGTAMAYPRPGSGPPIAHSKHEPASPAKQIVTA